MIIVVMVWEEKRYIIVKKKKLVLAFLLESYPELITISTNISRLFSYPTSY